MRFLSPIIHFSQPFTELPYIDAMDIFETRFNTSGDTLAAVYEELIESELIEFDPVA
jgi:hypothetical protein